MVTSNNQRIHVLFTLVILGLFMLVHSSSATLNGRTNQANVALTNSSDLCKDVLCTSEQYCDSGKCICMTNFTCASSCDNVLCGTDDYCTQGKCVKKGSDLCKDIVCTSEQYCDSGKCICRTNFTCNGASNVYRPLTFILLLCVAILVAM